MYRTACVMVLVALCAGLAHSSWDIVRGVDNRLEFVDINGTKLHTENVTSDKINAITYDPLNNRVLFSDTNAIFSFDVTTKKTECLIRTTNFRVSYLAYDPATELLVWLEDIKDIYSMSLKPISDKNKVNEKHLIFSDDFNYIFGIAVDSCGGFVYFPSGFLIKRVPLNGSEKEVVIDNGLNYIHSLAIDQQAQQIYFTDNVPSLKSADLNGNNTRTILALNKKAYSLTISNGSMYWLSLVGNHSYDTLMQIPNPPRGKDVEPKPFIERVETHWWSMAAYININDIKEIQNCDNLKSLQPNNLVSTDLSLLCVHGTKVCGEYRCECTQGYSGERCEVSLCHNYCVYGNCSIDADGQPKCSCYAGYSGDRCEVNWCQEYCLNGGLCSLSKEGKPLCRCTGHFEGERCDVPVFQTKCFQAISLLKDMFNTDITSAKEVTSTCASTVAPPHPPHCLHQVQQQQQQDVSDAPEAAAGSSTVARSEVVEEFTFTSTTATTYCS